MAKYKSLADIQKDFDRRLRDAADEDRPQIEREQMQAQLEFYGQREAQREIEDARRAAFERYPEAKGLEVMVNGTDPETIEAQAKAVHEFVMQRAQQAQPPENNNQPPQNQPTPERTQEYTREQLEAMYGRPGVGMGAPPQAPDERADLLHKLKGMGGGEQHESTPGRQNQHASRYLRLRTQDVMKVAKENPGTRIGMRSGAQVPNE